jgi:biopolymer transport protein ExbB
MMRAMARRRHARLAAAAVLAALSCLPLAASRAAEEAKASPPRPAPAAGAAARETTARAAAAEPEVKPRETILSLIVKGRWIMIPLGICSIILVTFAIERALSLRQGPVGRPELIDEVFERLPPRGRATREHIAAALAACDESRSIIGRVLHAGVEKVHRDEAHAQAHVEEAAAREAHVLKRKLRPFQVIFGLGPLLGLLGTISGMITCFENATAADASARVATLTRGIYEALVATATGLFVAIIALIIYHWFQGRVDRVIDRIDEAGSRFLEHYYGVPASAKQRGTHAAAAGAVQAAGSVADAGG